MLRRRPVRHRCSDNVLVHTDTCRHRASCQSSTRPASQGTLCWQQHRTDAHPASSTGLHSASTPIFAAARISTPPWTSLCGKRRNPSRPRRLPSRSKTCLRQPAGRQTKCKEPCAQVRGSTPTICRGARARSDFEATHRRHANIMASIAHDNSVLLSDRR